MQALSSSTLNGYGMWNARPRAATVAPVEYAPQDIDALMRQASERVGGDVSVTAVHVESGARYAFEGGREMFMAETQRFPLAVYVLSLVDRRVLGLHDSVVIRRADLRPEWDGLKAAASKKTIRIPTGRTDTTLTVAQLLEQSVGVVDPTAMDLLLRLAGGPRRVQAGLVALGVRDVRFDRSTLEQRWDFIGARPEDRLVADADSFKRVQRETPADVRAEASRRFHDDPRDRATSDAVSALLVRLARGELISDSTRRFLVQIERENPAPRVRFANRPPADASYLRFSASWSGWHTEGAANETALVLLPNGNGRLAISVMASGMTIDDGDTLRAVFADVGRAVYNRFAVKERTRE